MKLKVLLATVLFAFAAPVFAEAGDWLFRFGGSTVMPKSDNNDVVEVDDDKDSVAIVRAIISMAKSMTTRTNPRWSCWCGLSVSIVGRMICTTNM